MKPSVQLFIAVLAAGVFLSACSQEKTLTPAFFPHENPEALSDWGMFSASKGVLQLGEGVTPYDLATPLFSDYALKLRTVWIPGGAAQYDADNAFDFPLGTVITKTFYYPLQGNTDFNAVTYGPDRTVNNGVMKLEGYRLIETRILVRREEGWAALPYVWNDEQTDAVLQRTGAIKPMTLHRPDGRSEDFSYLVPNANQCAACHATNASTKEIQPIGMKARHLNKRSTFNPSVGQLNDWITLGLLSGDFDEAIGASANVDYRDGTIPVAIRARSYLDINCSHCHNPNGAADTSGLDLEPGATGPALGVCKSPIAAGGGSGGLPFDIVPGATDQSITLFRMETTDPGAMMPELGRAITHEEGVELISSWISAMDGDCG
ncbi:MAG: hypothetical protein DHS20C05_02280 [Hyphococcus sp.]|nr:MAG: hypothetical protein DHS20C05_02280 [Marinicaulis sp.]